MRVMALLVWALVMAALAWPALRRRLPPGGDASRRDELVKDPVCQTYIVRARAVRRTTDGEITYFCSAECARRYVSS